MTLLRQEKSPEDLFLDKLPNYCECYITWTESALIWQKHLVGVKDGLVFLIRDCRELTSVSESVSVFSVSFEFCFFFKYAVCCTQSQVLTNRQGGARHRESPMTILALFISLMKTMMKNESKVFCTQQR